MAKRLYGSDIEADDLLDGVTKLWCATFTELDASGKELDNFTLNDYKEMHKIYGDKDAIVIMHNGIAYDKAAYEKVTGFTMEAEVVDTLYLSWYLYPKLLKHGLAAHGEMLGIAKPEIDDWENLTLEQYEHRCQEDVKIQVALWRQIWKHLLLLYKTPADAWHLIRHLNFKARCAALQEKSKWKLDVPGTEAAVEMFSNKFDAAKEALEARLPEVPVYATRTRPKKPYKNNGELSKGGENWKKLVGMEVDPEEYFHGDPLDYDGDIKVITKYKPPNAGSSKQLKEWLYTLGWVPESFKYDRNKETNEVRQIPQIKDPDTEELCESIARLIPVEPALEFLREMSVVKHRLGVVQGFLRNVDDQGYVYAAVQGLTNTLRFKHKICVNLPSARKPYGELIRGLLVAETSATELCGSDMSSLEDRTKQHFMWKHDPEYVKEMMSDDFDPHCDMAVAANLMTEEEADVYKQFDKKTATPVQMETYTALALVRHAGKSTNYAATYGARGPTIARSAGVDESVGDELYEAYWQRNWSLIAIADECIVKNSRGMKWLWNPVSKMWLYLKAEKDRFSTLNQSTGTYAFDRWVYYLLEQRPQLTGQFHDEVVLELKVGNREAMTRMLKKAVGQVNDELQLFRDLDCDVDFGRNYAHIH